MHFKKLQGARFADSLPLQVLGRGIKTKALHPLPHSAQTQDTISFQALTLAPSKPERLHEMWHAVCILLFCDPAAPGGINSQNFPITGPKGWGDRLLMREQRKALSCPGV